MMQAIRSMFNRFMLRDNKGFQDADEEGRFRSYSISCAIGVPLMIAFGVYSLLTGNALLSLVIFASSTGLIMGWYLLYQCIASSLVYRTNALLFCFLLLYMVYIGGADGSKALWCYVFPLVAYFLLGNREGTIWIAALFLGCQVIIWNLLQLPIPHAYPADFSIRFSLSLLCVTIITSFYEKFRFTYRTEVEKQNRLLNTQILERQRAEEALRKSEKKYKAIYLQAAEGIIVIDTAGTILECNPQMNTMLGYPSDELVGANIHDLIHPEDLKKIPSQMPEILSGETVLLERRMRTADGGYRLFERSGRRVEENRILLLYRDITDRKAAEIALAKANRELDRLANIDGLTQIANRRKFESSLRAEWQRLARERLPLTMILGDIDYFKQYNDIYGHQEGDACLILIAQTLAHILNRPADMVSRFGGEEFIILLPNTALEGGVQIAETIRKAIAGLRIPHQGSECSPYVTMSLGVGSLIPSQSILPDDLVAVADKALYQAKQGGRNRVEVGDSRLLG